MIVIYNIVDPVTMDVIYVGRTNNFEKRKLQHLSKTHNTRLRKRISAIHNIGLQPIFNIVSHCDSGIDFSKEEKNWILHFEKLGYVLCNKKIGEHEKVMATTIGGQPATQKNVTMLDSKIKIIEDAGKLAYMSFSAYVNKLIDADLHQHA